MPKKGKPLVCQYCQKNGHGAKACRRRLADVAAAVNSTEPLNEHRDQ